MTYEANKTQKGNAATPTPPPTYTQLSRLAIAELVTGLHVVSKAADKNGASRKRYIYLEPLVAFPFNG